MERLDERDREEEEGEAGMWRNDFSCLSNDQEESLERREKEPYGTPHEETLSFFLPILLPFLPILPPYLR